MLQAYAMAQSNGNGDAFAKAAAQSSTISDCFGQSLGFSQASASAQASHHSNFCVEIGKRAAEGGDSIFPAVTSEFKMK
jgi:hypothetical protein